MTDEVYVSTTAAEDHRHRRNLAIYAREALARALTIKGITAGTHSIDITEHNTLRLELDSHEAQHLANMLEEGHR